MRSANRSIARIAYSVGFRDVRPRGQVRGIPAHIEKVIGFQATELAFAVESVLGL